MRKHVIESQLAIQILGEDLCTAHSPFQEQILQFSQSKTLRSANVSSFKIAVHLLSNAVFLILLPVKRVHPVQTMPSTQEVLQYGGGVKYRVQKRHTFSADEDVQYRSVTPSVLWRICKVD